MRLPPSSLKLSVERLWRPHPLGIVVGTGSRRANCRPVDQDQSQPGVHQIFCGSTAEEPLSCRLAHALAPRLILERAKSKTIGSKGAKHGPATTDNVVRILGDLERN